MQLAFATGQPWGTHDTAIQLLTRENRILELIARNSPLPVVLTELVQTAQQYCQEEVTASILLLEEGGKRLLHGAAPDLPEAYNQAIDGILIGPSVGSCGTAAFLKKPVVVVDIASDPLWTEFKEVALQHNLRACWSTPILDSEGEVLGTFALYYRRCAEPSDNARQIIDLLSRTAGIAIEKHRSERQRQQYEQEIETLNRTGILLNAEHDLEKIVQSATDTATELSGAAFGAFFYNAYDEHGGKYTLCTISGVSREAFSKFPMPRNTDVFAPTFRGDGVVRVPDITKDPRYGKNSPHHGMPQGHLPVRSYLAVPVLSRSGGVIGGMFFGHSEVDVFTARAERLVTSLAAQAAVAIDNAQLHEGLARKIADYEAVQQRLAIAQQTARLAAWELDLSSGEISFTPGSASIFPLPLEKIATVEDWHGVVFSEDQPHVKEVLEHSIEGQGDYSVEYRLAPDGVRWIQGRGHVVRDEKTGKPACLIVLSMDITERKRSEKALQAAEERFRLVVESADLGFWYCDLPFEKLNWDATVKEHFWIPPEVEVTIEMFYERIHPDDRERTRSAIALCIDTHSPYDLDYRTVSPSGQTKWIRAVGRAFYDENGAPHRFDGVTMDISARKSSEDALRNSEKLAATGRLAATIAHEINNPLEAVTNFIYLAATDPDLPATARRNLETADQELSRVTHIARQTLGFYRDTSGPVTVAVRELINDVVALYQRRLAYKSLETTVRCDDGLEVFALAGELRQVVSNLLANAIDASSAKGRILIRVRRFKDGKTGEHNVQISIADNGSGMNREVQERLFTPFFTTKADVGTGLGLWVTKGIIEKAGGTIRFRSRTGAKSGTVFNLVLPIAPRAQAHTV